MRLRTTNPVLGSCLVATLALVACASTPVSREAVATAASAETTWSLVTGKRDEACLDVDLAVTKQKCNDGFCHLGSCYDVNPDDEASTCPADVVRAENRACDAHQLTGRVPNKGQLLRARGTCDQGVCVLRFPDDVPPSVTNTGRGSSSTATPRFTHSASRCTLVRCRRSACASPAAGG